MPTQLDVRCANCRRIPDNIVEYIDAAAEYGMTPEEYVMDQEGTFNGANGHFYCTECYIELGMPLGVAP